jgi:hypothetical protein
VQIGIPLRIVDSIRYPRAKAEILEAERTGKPGPEPKAIIVIEDVLPASFQSRAAKQGLGKAHPEMRSDSLHEEIFRSDPSFEPKWEIGTQRSHAFTLSPDAFELDLIFPLALWLMIEGLSSLAI